MVQSFISFGLIDCWEYKVRTMVRSQAMKNMTIAALARQGGVGVETVRYYQRRGLIDTPERSGGVGLVGGVRRYGEEDIRRLRFIRSAQSAGFTLDEIGELLQLDAGEDRQRARALAAERIAALDAKIAELQGARDSLRRLAHACGSTSSGPCPIITAFDRE
jgi:MerR family mercuric resistance operon transcriptional regulator